MTSNALACIWHSVTMDPKLKDETSTQVSLRVSVHTLIVVGLLDRILSSLLCTMQRLAARFQNLHKHDIKTK